MLESEAETMMIQIDTGKHQAICTALGIPTDAPADTFMDAVLDRLSLYDIYHRGIGWIEAQLFKRDTKKKGKAKQT